MLLPQLRVPITGDTAGLRAALAQARQQLTTFEQQASRDAARVQSSMGMMAGAQSAFLKAAGLAIAAKQITDYADAWTTAGNKIASASQIAGRQARSLSALNDIANETRTGLTETADLYAKLLRSTAQVAESEEEVARATEIVNKAFKAGGAATSEQIAGILQLSQALGSGVLQGDELRSIRENAPLVAAAIAEEFDTTVAGLKKLGAEGKLTSDRIFDAILAAAPKVEAAFAVTQGTIGDSWTVLQNRIMESVGTLDSAFGGTQALREEFQRLGLAIEGLAGWFLDMQQPIENIDARIRSFTNTIADAAEAAGRFMGIQELLGTDSSSGELRVRGAFRDAESGAADIGLRRALQDRVRTMRTPTTPAFGSGAGAGAGGSGRSPGEKFGDDIEAIRRRTESLQLETQVVGLNTYERERAMTVMRLEQEARRAGITDIEQYRSQIEAEAHAYATATVILQEREAALNSAREAQEFLAQGLFELSQVNSLDEIGESAVRLVAALRQAVMQALLLGQGPLAGIFGAKNPQGGVGGLFGRLLGMGGGGALAPLSAGAASLTGAGLFHSGGTVGPDHRPIRFVPSSVFDDAPRFHRGLALGPRERPAILEDGETVLPRGMRGGDVNVRIVQEGGVKSEVRNVRRRPDGGVDLEVLSKRVLDMVGNEYGLQPRLRAR